MRTSLHARTVITLGVLALVVTGCRTGTDDSADAEVADAAPVGVAADTLAAPAPTRGEAAAPGITVEGSGRISGQPDTLTATVGVEVERPTVQEALDAGNEGAQRVMDAVTATGVATEDVQTARFDVHPRYDHGPGQEAPVIRGYLVSNLLEVRIRDVDAAGEVLAAATEAGGGDARVQGIRFGLEDNDALVAEARERAFADARSRAEDYARLAERELGALVSVDETLTPAPPAERFGDDMALEEAAAAADVPIQPGEQEVEVRVVTVWSLG